VTARHATRKAIMTYLRIDTEPAHRTKIIRYMQDTFGVRPPTTRQALTRMIRDGLVDQVDGAWYKVRDD